MKVYCVYDMTNEHIKLREFEETEWESAFKYRDEYKKKHKDSIVMIKEEIR